MPWIEAIHACIQVHLLSSFMWGFEPGMATRQDELKQILPTEVEMVLFHVCVCEALVLTGAVGPNNASCKQRLALYHTVIWYSIMVFPSRLGQGKQACSRSLAW